MVDFVDRRSGTGKEEPGEKKIIDPTSAAAAAHGPELEDYPADSAGALRGDFVGLSEYLFANIQMMLHESTRAKPEEREMIFQMSRQWISWLEALQKKTAGNLGEIEGKHLEACLHQSRLAYVAAINTPPGAGQEKSPGDRRAGD